MPEIKTEFLFTMALEFEISVLGNTPYGVRRIARLSTGSFEGPKLNGTVLPGGGGWMLIRSDDVLEIEVWLILETDDKQQIYMNWKGLRHGPKEVIDRLTIFDVGIAVERDEVAFFQQPLTSKMSKCSCCTSSRSLLALNRHDQVHCKCPLSGVKRTWR